MASATAFQFDTVGGDTAGNYPSDLYRPTGTVPVLAGGVDAIDDVQVASYRDRGHLAVAQVISADKVKAAMDAIDDLVAGRNQEFNGVIYEAAARDSVEKLDLQDRLDKVRKLAWFVRYDQRLNQVAEDPNLLEAVSKLLGGHAPRLFQDMALLKPPRIGREKPWHQDHAYFDFEITEPVVGVWIALDEATVDNGCMQVIDRGHKAGPVHHWMRRDWQICDTDMVGKTSLACPLEPGGALFFDSLLPHGTPKNDSPRRRRALQLHYCRASAKKIPKQQRLAIFGTDGKDVTC